MPDEKQPIHSGLEEGLKGSRSGVYSYPFLCLAKLSTSIYVFTSFFFTSIILINITTVFLN